MHITARTDDTHFGPPPDPKLACILGMHVDHRLGESPVQLRYPSGHRTGMPVLKYPPGHQPQRKLLIRCLGGRLVGHRINNGPSISLAIEMEVTSFFYIGVVLGVIAPRGLLTLHDRPPQAADLVINLERRQVMRLAPGELGVLFEQPLLYIKARS